MPGLPCRARGLQALHAARHAKAYEVIDHSFDVVIVGAGGAGLRAALGMALDETLCRRWRDRHDISAARQSGADLGKGEHHQADRRRSRRSSARPTGRGRPPVVAEADEQRCRRDRAAGAHPDRAPGARPTGPETQRVTKEENRDIVANEAPKIGVSVTMDDRRNVVLARVPLVLTFM